MNSKKIFLTCFLGGFFLVSGLFVWLVVWYIPRLAPEGWLREVLWCKLDIAARTPSPKIIVLSGSNAFFGMDSATMEKKCGYPVVNLAFHATFPISYYEYLLKDVLKEGDMVIMPLELAHYTRPSEKNKLVMLAGMGWGKEFFPAGEPMENALFYTFSTVWDYSFVKRIPKNIRKFRKNRPADREATLKAFRQSIDRPDGRTPDTSYSFTNMNRYGDIVHTKTKEFSFMPKLTTTVPSPFFLQSFRKLQNFVRSRNAGIALVWPVLFTGDELSPILDLKRNCRSAGITIHGDPAKFMFPAEDFADTYYHLRSSAAKKRTEILADCMLENGLLPVKRPPRK